MTPPRDRRELEEYVARRLAPMLPTAIARLQESAAAGDRRAQAPLKRIEREHPQLVHS